MRTTETASSRARVPGSPHTNTSTLRMSHGIQAPRTSRREWPCGLSPMGGVSRPASPQRSRGCQCRSRRVREAMETTAETTSTSQGPWRFEIRSCGTANEAPATAMAGQIPSVPRSPAKAQTSQKGTTSEKTGSCRPTIALRRSRSSPVTLWRATIGVPSAPKATGAVLAISDRPEASSGEKPSPMRMAPVTATGVPKPEAPSKNAPKQKATRRSWRRRSRVTPVMLSRSTAKEPRCSVRWYRKITLRTIHPMGRSP